MHPLISIVYQITQECPFDCGFCLRRYSQGETLLNSEGRKKLVDVLKEKNIGRLNITGGEPLILGKKLHDFLMYVHDKQIHTCLTTTGFGLTKEDLIQMDSYLDQILLSFHSEKSTDWEEIYNNKKYGAELYRNVIDILEWCKETSIIIEVNTVVHKDNINQIIEIGDKLLRINSNIVWRLDEYYGIGLKEASRSDYEITAHEFENIQNQVNAAFKGLFKDIKYTSANQRNTSPGFLITHAGEIVTTSNHLHSPTGFNLVSNSHSIKFEMLREWAEYKKVCRDWGWGDF